MGDPYREEDVELSGRVPEKSNSETRCDGEGLHGPGKWSEGELSIGKSAPNSKRDEGPDGSAHPKRSFGGKLRRTTTDHESGSRFAPGAASRAEPVCGTWAVASS